MRRVKIPYYLITEDYLHVTYDFIIFKQCFSNGIIYNLHFSKVQAQLKRKGYIYSQARVKRILSDLIGLGLLSDDGVFESNKNKNCISVPLKELRYQIRRLVVMTKFKQQEYAIQAKKNLKSPRSLKEYKSAQRAVKKLNGESLNVWNSRIMLSMDTISDLLDVSKTTAFNVINRMVKEGSIDKYTATRSYRRVGDIRYRKPNCYVLNC